MAYAFSLVPWTRWNSLDGIPRYDQTILMVYWVTQSILVVTQHPVFAIAGYDPPSPMRQWNGWRYALLGTLPVRHLCGICYGLHCRGTSWLGYLAPNPFLTTYPYTLRTLLLFHLHFPTHDPKGVPRGRATLQPGLCCYPNGPASRLSLLLARRSECLTHCNRLCCLCRVSPALGLQTRPQDGSI